VKQCKDCPPGSKRPAPFPGPRCATHHRAITKLRKKANHERRVQVIYGLAPGEYERLYAAQGGRCAICQTANGKTKRLAVDHNHTTGAVRGLLCGPCNQLVGRLRDSPAAFLRGYQYLSRGPA
jgi:hypothetical protein